MLRLIDVVLFLEVCLVLDENWRLLSSNGSRANAKTNKSLIRGRERFVSLLYRSSGLVGFFFSEWSSRYRHDFMFTVVALAQSVALEMPYSG